MQKPQTSTKLRQVEVWTEISSGLHLNYINYSFELDEKV